jgi:hypothetical protein
LLGHWWDSLGLSDSQAKQRSLGWLPTSDSCLM